jgi:RNA polymerase sigma factor (sigma-70 family)
MFAKTGRSVSALRVDDIAQPAVLGSTKLALVQDDGSIDVLYARHWSELCRYIKKHFGAGPPDPEDIVQETFIKYAAIEDLQTIDNPRAYLFRTAHNVLVDERRKLAVRRVTPADGEPAPMSDDRTPERVLVGRERLQVLRRTLRAMPEARRRSFLLNRLQGLSAAAIARKTGYSESAVKKHIGLALADLEAAVTDAESIAPSDSA